MLNKFPLSVQVPLWVERKYNRNVSNSPLLSECMIKHSQPFFDKKTVTHPTSLRVAVPSPPPPAPVKRKQGNVYASLTLIVFHDVTLIYAK